MERIFEVIRQYRMIEPGMHVIAGVSGGADSVCLLYALSEYRKREQFELTAVHVEHGIRGKDSLEDAAFVGELCKSLGVLCLVVHTKVEQVAKEQGISVEEAGRMERYRIFREQAQAHQVPIRIAVAHNRGDQAETVLWNLVRGSGLSGLCGMRPVRDGLIRPLLFTDRAEIEQILQKAGLSWRTDRTNLETQYTRNRIRLSILPQMEEQLNSRAGIHIAQASERLWQVQQFVERMTDEAAARGIHKEKEEVLLGLEAYREQDGLIQQELLRRAVAECAGGRGLKDVTGGHLAMLEELAQKDCGRCACLPGGIRVVREAQALRFTREQPEEEPGAGRTVYRQETEAENTGVKEDKRTEAEGENGVQDGPAELWISGAGSYALPGWSIEVELLENTPQLWPEIIREKKYTKWLSYDTIKSNILFRTRRPGDYLVVQRGGGRKKLKDYLIDEKIPRSRRDHLWLLADGAHVLWVPGLRISEAAKVDKGTKTVIKIQMKEEPL